MHISDEIIWFCILHTLNTGSCLCILHKSFNLFVSLKYFAVNYSEIKRFEVLKNIFGPYHVGTYKENIKNEFDSPNVYSYDLSNHYKTNLF